MGSNFINPGAQILPQKKSYWEQLMDHYKGVNAEPFDPVPLRDSPLGRFMREYTTMGIGDLNAIEAVMGFAGAHGNPLLPRSNPGEVGMGMNLKDWKNREILGNFILQRARELGERLLPLGKKWGAMEDAELGKDFLYKKYPDISELGNLQIEAPSIPQLMDAVKGHVNKGYFRPTTIVPATELTKQQIVPRQTTIVGIPAWLNPAQNTPSRHVNAGTHELIHALENQNKISSSPFKIWGQSGGRDIKDYIQPFRGEGEMPIEELLRKTPTVRMDDPESVALHKDWHNYMRMKAYLEQPTEKIAYRGEKTGENAWHRVIQHIHDETTKDYPTIDMGETVGNNAPILRELMDSGLLTDIDKKWFIRAIEAAPEARLSSVLAPSFLKMTLKNAGIRNIRIKGKFDPEGPPTIETVGTPMETFWDRVKEDFYKQNDTVGKVFPDK